jgi:hypothetical protein
LIQRALRLLVKLQALEETLERASLMGSVYKRRALIEEAMGKYGRMAASLRQMKRRYERAHAIGVADGASDVYYPASNRLAADVALNAGRRGWRGLDRPTAAVVRSSLAAKHADEADFWSVVGEIELQQYEALARRRLATAYPQLSKAYEDLHKRVSATRMWASVYDTACLVLPSYAGRVTGSEKSTAAELLAQLRAFAHPEGESVNAQ